MLVFFGLAMAALDYAFRDAGENALRDLLDIQLYALLSASEETNDNSLGIPPDLPEARFANPGSGLYGELRINDGDQLWKSDSSVGAGLEYGLVLDPGERRYSRMITADGDEVMALSMGIEWLFDDGSLEHFTYSVAESMASYYAQVNRFRNQLLGWFVGLMIMLLLSQLLLLRWLARPLQQIEQEITEVEHGERGELSSGYPSELNRLTQNMNALIGNERARLERYRNTLANLAHSLKTPLAVMRAQLERPGTDKTVLDKQLTRMDKAIRYQLNWASASGGRKLGQSLVDPQRVAIDISEALTKVYADKAPDCSVSAEDGLRFYGDEGDLTELLGNLMDNAFKWCVAKVTVSLTAIAGDEQQPDGLAIVIEDDGPGIEKSQQRAVLERGARADEQLEGPVEGHGIGLAIVYEIVRLYRAEIVINRSRLGGAHIEIRFAPF